MERASGFQEALETSFVMEDLIDPETGLIKGSPANEDIQEEDD